MLEMKEKKERVILVALGKEKEVQEFDSQDPLEEIRLLTETAGADVVGELVQHRSNIEPKYYIGSGKAEELHELVESLEATTVIFDNDLTPAQVSNLEKLLEVKVIDRSGLILDIFALRARTKEARVQVELAQLKHMLPRLTRQWTHLSRQVGGIGVRGPGETQLEVDRRRMRERIAHLTEVLEKIEKQRLVSRSGRKTFYKVSLVGYTNTGKSTLFNRLTMAEAPVENLLFKTLDSTTRLVKYGDIPFILVSDTVGFIRNLPHELVASFKSTLADVRDADLLIHVVDLNNPLWRDQYDTVENVLKEIETSTKDIITVFNKIDLIENKNNLEILKNRYISSAMVSAKTGTGIIDLKNIIKESALKGKPLFTMEFGPENREYLPDIYKYGTIIETVETGDTFEMTFNLPVSIARKIGLME